MEAEVHIAGVLVHAREGQARAVEMTLRDFPALDVHAVSDDGKLVVVCECSTGEEVLAEIQKMRDLPEVVDVALVYQHAEPAGTMDEEMGNDGDQTRLH